MSAKLWIEMGKAIYKKGKEKYKEAEKKKKAPKADKPKPKSDNKETRKPDSLAGPYSLADKLRIHRNQVNDIKNQTK